MSEEHSYRSIDIPDNAPFGLEPSPINGWGAFATRRIDRGSLILSEQPLCNIPLPTAWLSGRLLAQTFARLPPRHQEQLLSLHSPGSFTTVMEVFGQNSFISASQDAATGTEQYTCILYILHSRFNHSCVPNIRAEFGNNMGGLQNFALRDIAVGEELVCSYYGTIYPGSFRHEREERLHFDCDCPACRPGTLFYELSEMRRTLIRGLCYLLYGRDIYAQEDAQEDAQEERDTPPIILDQTLRTAAENHSIPVPNRLVYVFLVAILLEEEGLPVDYIIEAILSHIIDS
ncbi:hypothetical protein FE257_004475 [Aspergillus nanangensis]|uniref:SET domain-containing protein n=1 Tax=Aspergillus nanangensis TaxID=2582783 RepID=A0AAD4GYF3_ASPNN|nr:hypothetical protein FE257_004475 [Aspergillus nanangensis]